MLNQVQQGLPTSAKSKFDDAILHWTAKRLPDGWQKQVVDTLAPVAIGNDIVVAQYGDDLEIGVFHRTLQLTSKRSVGTVKLGDGDWMAALILLRLAKFLPIEMVDDSSNPVDRRTLKSLFIERGHLFMTHGSSLDEYEDFATIVGLVPKLDVSTNEALSHFF